MNGFYSNQNQLTLILAKVFVQELSGLVLYNLEELLTCLDEL